MHEYEYKIIDDFVEYYLYNRQGEKFTCYVDLDDWDRVKNHKYRWYADPNNKCVYISTTIYLECIDGKSKNKKISMHRWILNYTGKGRIDHKNYNGLDNRKSNLRIIAQESNVKHRQEKNKNNTSGYRNVSWNKYYQQWVVQLQINKTNKILGYFNDVDEAGKFAEEMRKTYYGEFAGES